MLPIPDLTKADIAFGNIKHLPRYESLPPEFQSMNDPHCHAVSMWFFKGAKRAGQSIEIDGDTYHARDGVDAVKAVAALQAALGSFEPKHEQKIGGCGFLLKEWFERKD